RPHRDPGLFAGALGSVHGGVHRRRHHGLHRSGPRRSPDRPRQARTARRAECRSEDPRRPRHGCGAADRVIAERSTLVSTLKQATGPAYTRIYSVGAARGENAVPNDDLVGPIDSSDEWIRQRTGIITRTRAVPETS